jgi:hypothetical protein
MPTPEPLTFEFNRRRQIFMCVFMAIGSPLLLIQGVASVIYFPYFATHGRLWFGILATVETIFLLVPAAIWGVRFTGRSIRQVRNREPAVVVSVEGVECRASWYDIGVLRWDDLEQIRSTYRDFRLLQFGKFKGLLIRRHPVLLVRPKPNFKLIARVPRFERWLAYPDLRWGYLLVMGADLNVSLSDLMKQLNAYYLANVVDKNHPVG